MTYEVSSREYLKRAKQCLEKNENQFLYYAAFEIRCGVEARMQEYLKTQQHISKRKQQGWKIATLGKNIENVFKLGQKDAVLRVRDSDTKELLLEARYTPVKAELKKKTQKIGKYLHSAKKQYDSDDEFWKNFRSELEAMIEELERATTGRMLGPLLVHPDKKHIDVKLELITREDHEAAKRISISDKTILQVDYE
ncbi:MAG: hypothetical protein OER04_19390 [Cyclobacteriaceae bacterium]|nr:hypothetical protein [Cyclobacteriaceae bacterium]